MTAHGKGESRGSRVTVWGILHVSNISKDLKDIVATKHRNLMIRHGISIAFRGLRRPMPIYRACLGTFNPGKREQHGGESHDGSSKPGSAHRRNRYVSPPIKDASEIDKFFERPTWSVRDLLPPEEVPASSTDKAQESSPETDTSSVTSTSSYNKPTTPTKASPDSVKPTSSTILSSSRTSSMIQSAERSPPATEITPTRLRQLLRLCALPPPSSPEEEASMLHDLRSQLHFVREIQKVDTRGVKPLVSIRDETDEGQKEAEIGIEDVKEALDEERVVGKWHKRMVRLDDPKVRERNEAEEWDVLGQAPRRVGRFFVVESGENEGAGGG